jgi:TonB family protein
MKCREGYVRALAMIAAVLAAPLLATAQDDPLRTARDLYASAAYEEALTELARVGSSGATPATTRDTNAYRAFCLVALGRAAEAQTVAESLVRADPLLSIDQFADASPRIAAMYTDVRKRVLPQLVKEEYRTARAHALEAAADAQSRLLHVRALLGVAEQIGAADETLADMRMLVDGFLDLARAAEPRQPPDPPAVPAAVPDPVSPPAAVVPAPAGTGATAPAETGVTPPTAVYQPQPSVPPALLEVIRALRRPAAIDVVINERGTVDEVTVTQSVNAAYDALIVATARTWKYKPALKDGVPIRFTSSVVINVSGK